MSKRKDCPIDELTGKLEKLNLKKKRKNIIVDNDIGFFNLPLVIKNKNYYKYQDIVDIINSREKILYKRFNNYVKMKNDESGYNCKVENLDNNVK